MKKFVMGVIVGIAITASATAFADEIESIVGKTVQGQFPVKIDGVTLDKQAAVIDGTSYLPVRAIGDAIGRDVTFDADMGIELKKKEAILVPEQTTKAEPVQSKVDRIKVIGYRISELETEIIGIKFGIKQNEETGHKDSESYKNLVEMLPKKEDELSMLQTELAELQKQ